MSGIREKYIANRLLSIKTGARAVEESGCRARYALFDDWSRTGRKYGGTKKTQVTWRSFKPDLENPVTIGMLFWMARNAGVSKKTICAEAEALQKIGGKNGAA